MIRHLPGQPCVGKLITESLKILCGAQVAYLDHLTPLITDNPCRRNDEAAFWKLKIRASPWVFVAVPSNPVIGIYLYLYKASQGAQQSNVATTFLEQLVLS